MKFTDKSIDNLKTGDQEQWYHSDDLGGWSLRVTKAGKKVWYLYKRIGGKPVKRKIGEYPVVSAEDARKAVLDYLREPDRLLPVNLRTSAPTLREAIDSYYEARSLKPRTVETYEQLFRLYIPDWDDIRIDEITEPMIVQRYNELGDPKVGRQNLMRSLRAVLRFYGYDPVQVLHRKRMVRKPRPRIARVPTRDIPEYLRAVRRYTVRPKGRLSRIDPELVSDIVHMYLMTGCRRTELMKLKWDAVILEPEGRERFVLEDPKNRSKVELPLSSYATRIIRRRHDEKRSDIWVFSSRLNPKVALHDIRKGTQPAHDHLGVDWNIHDYRRTFATICELVGTPHLITKRLLNHLSGDVTFHYTLPDVEDMRPWSEKVSAFMLTGNIDGIRFVSADEEPQEEAAEDFATVWDEELTG